MLLSGFRKKTTELVQLAALLQAVISETLALTEGSTRHKQGHRWLTAHKIGTPNTPFKIQMITDDCVPGNY